MLFMPWERSGFVQAENPRHERACRGYDYRTLNGRVKVGRSPRFFA